MAHRMQDKIVIITGASSGLGRATAELMVAEGARVVMADVNREAGEAAANAIGADFVRTDVADPAEVETLVTETASRYGRLDVMCNNAGVHAAASLLETTNEDFERLVAVNFGGVFYGTRAAGRVMAEQGSGVIVNTASNGGYLPTEGMAVYCGTKAAVVAMSKACALELAPKGVRVNTISPGTMLSGMVPDVAGVVEVLDRLQPIGYAANPSQMATGIVYLASDDANYVTGHDLIVDGGATAGRVTVGI
ncbi:MULTISPECIES: SDR family NAD(P)-dependent oxidoreductase [unclassified Rhodococcus (in: high G+C Gram-positive bacteria)]|jgi:3-oxoacyl-[acyl-carrier protein] reductase|uniref:SDR family NAD(P)-dependent oxidoreductase n=1 Tax=unclassified Rhodococcus (in: high G+C Gram-positive bacteria) TaxID=192944 RepID=UPI001F0ECC61|nr:glucose 1-dehydrogenase [Rhodococcus sp. BL-253-APC-6A1W]